MAWNKPWVFSPSVDLDEWLPVLGTEADSGQGPIFEGQADLICAFHPEYPPGIERPMLEQTPVMVSALQEALPFCPVDLQDRIKALLVAAGQEV